MFVALYVLCMVCESVTILIVKIDKEVYSKRIV